MQEKEKGIVGFLTPLVLGNMLNPLNSTMLSTAILTILTVFQQDPVAASLLITPLYFASAIGQPLMGALCDIFNPIKINIFGLILILLASVIGAFALSFEWLVVSRVLLGLGSSTAYPCAIILIRQRYEAKRKEVPGIILSIVAIAGQVSAVFGPFLGGLLLESAGWTGIFLVNIPLVLLCLAFYFLQKNSNVQYRKEENKSVSSLLKQLDIIGFLLFSCFLFSFLITLIYPSYLLQKILMTLALLALLIIRELKHPRPFIDVKVLGVNQTLNTVFLRQLGINFISYLVVYGLPQWLENIKSLTPSTVGLLMLPFSLMTMLLSLLVSRSKKYLGLLIIGLLCAALAAGGVFILHAESSLYLVVAVTITLGIATGILTIANQATLYAEAPKNTVGLSFGLFRTVGYIGAILAGSMLEPQMKAQAIDGSLHFLGQLCLWACLLIALSLIPMLLKKNIKKNYYST